MDEKTIADLKGRIRGAGRDRDWAFFKAKSLGEMQQLLLCRIAEEGGVVEKNFCPYAMGWRERLSLIDSLVRRGLVSLEEDKLLLVEGEPLQVMEAKLPKPFIRVKREPMELVWGRELRQVDATVWLDPRGDVSFHVILPEELQGLFENDPRTSRVDRYFTACADSAKAVKERAEALCTEFVARTQGTQEEMLYLEYDIITGENVSLYEKTGMAFRYDRVVLLNGKQLYVRSDNGGLKPFRRQENLPYPLDSAELRHAFAKRNMVLIRYTPERLLALESMRERLAQMARQFREVVTSAEFSALIDTHGHRLLPGGEVEKS